MPTSRSPQPAGCWDGAKGFSLAASLSPYGQVEMTEPQHGCWGSFLYLGGDEGGSSSPSEQGLLDHRRSRREALCVRNVIERHIKVRREATP